MGRQREGFAIRPGKTGVYHVRFTHNGRQHEPSLKTRDHAEAERRGAKVYSDTISGRVAPTSRVLQSASLADIVEKFVEGSHLSKPTLRSYGSVLRGFVVPYFKTIGKITADAIGDWAELRLRSKTDKTVKHDRAVLDAHCQEAGLIFGHYDCWRVVKQAAKAVLGARQAITMSPYDFRHNRITHLLEQSGNLPGTQYLAGQRLATTTDKYSHPSLRAAEAVIRGGIQGFKTGEGTNMPESKHNERVSGTRPRGLAGEASAQNHSKRVGAQGGQKAGRNADSRVEPYSPPTLTRIGRLRDSRFLAALTLPSAGVPA